MSNLTVLMHQRVNKALARRRDQSKRKVLNGIKARLLRAASRGSMMIEVKCDADRAVRGVPYKELVEWCYNNDLEIDQHFMRLDVMYISAR